MNEALPYKFWRIEGGEIPVPPFPMKHRHERGGMDKKLTLVADLVGVPRVLWNPPFKDKVVPIKGQFI